MAHKVSFCLSSRLRDSLAQSRALFSGERLFRTNPKLGLRAPKRSRITSSGSFSGKSERFYRSAGLISHLRSSAPLYSSSSLPTAQKLDPKVGLRISAAYPITGDSSFSTTSGKISVPLFVLSEFFKMLFVKLNVVEI